LDADSVKENIDGILGDVVNEIVTRHVPAESFDEQWDLPGLEAAPEAELGLGMDLPGLARSSGELDAAAIERHVNEAGVAPFAQRGQPLGAQAARALVQHTMFSARDVRWEVHLARMDYLRQGIHLRGYAQKQLKQEYKNEAFELFSEMLENVERQVVTML